MTASGRTSGRERSRRSCTKWPKALERRTWCTVEGLVGGSVYVLPRVLGPGFLDVNGARLAWSMATRRTGP